MLLLITITVLNSGDQTGKEVVQIYVSKANSGIDRPNQELKAFAKTRNLDPGEAQDIMISIPVSELSYWDEENSGWALEKGLYSVRSGSSSRDIRLIGDIDI